MVSATQKLISAVAASLLLAHHLPRDNSGLAAETLKYFSVAWTGILLWGFCIYPNLLDPLRSLPQPGRSVQDRLYRWLYHEPTPIQLLEWAKQTPNDGLLLYKGLHDDNRVVLTSGEAVKEALVHKSYEFEKPELARFRLGQAIGWGLLTSEGEVHKIQKKNLLPAFHYRAIKDLYPLFWSKASEFVETLSMQIQKSAAKSENGVPTATMDIGPWISRAALDIIGVAAWGKDFGTVQNSETEFNVKYRRQFRFSKGRAVAMRVQSLLPLWVTTSLPMRGPVREGNDAARKECQRAIKEKRSAKDLSDRKDILSVAMKSGVFDDEALEEQLLTLLAAGHETSALSATYGCYLLCKNPKVQQRLREEIRSNLPSPSAGETVDADLLDHIPYLRAVTNEVLRLMPAAPRVSRVANKDTTLLGQVIPKGTTIVATSFINNRLESTWGPDAEEFNPERWMVEHQETTGGAKSNYDFMSFSQGPRSCIGQGFARGEFLAMMAALVGRFRMELEVPDLVPDLFFGVTMRPTSPIRFKMEVLDRW